MLLWRSLADGDMINLLGDQCLQSYCLGVVYLVVGISTLSVIETCLPVSKTRSDSESFFGGLQ